MFLIRKVATKEVVAFSDRDILGAEEGEEKLELDMTVEEAKAKMKTKLGRERLGAMRLLDDGEFEVEEPVLPEPRVARLNKLGKLDSAPVTMGDLRTILEGLY